MQQTTRSISAPDLLHLTRFSIASAALDQAGMLKDGAIRRIFPKEVAPLVEGNESLLRRTIRAVTIIGVDQALKLAHDSLGLPYTGASFADAILCSAAAEVVEKYFFSPEKKPTPPPPPLELSHKNGLMFSLELGEWKNIDGYFAFEGRFIAGEDKHPLPIEMMNTMEGQGIKGFIYREDKLVPCIIFEEKIYIQDPEELATLLKNS